MNFTVSNIGLITLEQPKDENIIPEPAIEQQLEKRSWRESFSNVFKREKKEGIIAYRNKRRRNSNIETTEDMDVENLDWWTKYYASLEVFDTCFYCKVITRLLLILG